MKLKKTLLAGVLAGALAFSSVLVQAAELPGSGSTLGENEEENVKLEEEQETETGETSMNDSKEMARLAYDAMDDKLAKDITIIDISGVSVVADYFLIADGKNRNQVQAIANNVDEFLGKAGYHAKATEGYSTANWILMDYSDVIIHIFSTEDRAFYDLERIWKDGVEIKREDLDK